MKLHNSVFVIFPPKRLSLPYLISSYLPDFWSLELRFSPTTIFWRFCYFDVTIIL